MSFNELLVIVVPVFCIFGMPSALAALVLSQRYKVKMKQLDVEAGGARLRQLEEGRSALEARVRALEAIVASVDFEVNARLARLPEPPAAQALPPTSPALAPRRG